MQPAKRRRSRHGLTIASGHPACVQAWLTLPVTGNVLLHHGPYDPARNEVVSRHEGSGTARRANAAILGGRQRPTQFSFDVIHGDQPSVVTLRREWSSSMTPEQASPGNPQTPPGEKAAGGLESTPAGNRQSGKLLAVPILWTVLAVDAIVAVATPFVDIWYVRYTYRPEPPDVPLQAGVALIAVVTFLGVWTIQRRRPQADITSEMRDAIAAAVVVVYLVILSWSTFFPRITTSSGTLNPLTSTLITNFTALTGIVIGFYFSATAATNIAQHRSKPSAGHTMDSADRGSS